MEHFITEFALSLVGVGLASWAFMLKKWVDKTDENFNRLMLKIGHLWDKVVEIELMHERRLTRLEAQVSVCPAAKNGKLDDD